MAMWSANVFNQTDLFTCVLKDASMYFGTGCHAIVSYLLRRYKTVGLLHILECTQLTSE